MTIEVKIKIENAKLNKSCKYGDIWDAIAKAPVGGGIQETFESLGIDKADAASIRSRAIQKYGKGVFSVYQAGGMITIIRLKETQ